MSFMIHLQSGDGLNRLAMLAGLAGKSRPILEAAARSVRLLLQSHFQARDQTPNQLGGERTHFWLDVLKSTQIGPTDEGQSSVIVGDARLPQRVYGGTIRPKNCKMLAIPVDAAAYGRRPATFEMVTGLKLFCISAGGTVGLVTKGQHGYFGFGVWRYVLAYKVDQKADPQALPDREKIEQAAVDGAEKQLKIMIQRDQPMK